MDGKIYAGKRTKVAGLKWLRSKGVKTILYVESELFEIVPGEVRKEGESAKQIGLHFFHIPLSSITPPKIDQLDQAVSVMANSEYQPVYVHCDQGADRTGMVVAAYGIKIQRWSPEWAYEEMKANGFNSGTYFWWKPRLSEYAKKMRS